MKQCPKCEGIELYDDGTQKCPYCDTELVAYERKSRRNTDADSGAQQAHCPNPINWVADKTAEPVFEKHSGRKYEYRGMVVSISPTFRFATEAEKWFNAFFRGEPYQSGNPIHETRIRIEEINRSRISEKMRSLVYYGELNELDIGDDVSISAVMSGDRLIVKRLIINDVELQVRTRGLIPAIGIRLLTLLALILVVLLIMMTVSFFKSGGPWTILNALVAALVGIVAKLMVIFLPFIGMFIVYKLIIGWIFSGRKK